MKHTLRLASAAAAAVALALLGTGVPTANADPNPGIIDPNQPVSLTVTKYLGDPSTTYGDGTEDNTIQDATHIPLMGVDFDAYQVYYDAGLTNPVDLTTNAGWAAAADITGYTPTVGEIAAGSFNVGGTDYYLGTPTTLTTDVNGEAVFNTLDIGLYLVVEDLAGSGTIQKCPDGILANCETVDDTQVSPVYPFFVTLPMTNPDNLNTWMYDVYVYPKNQQATGTKWVSDMNTQTDESTSVGGPDTVTFTISTPITDGLSGPEMGMYRIIDDLDPRLTYDSLTVKIDGDGDLGTTGDQTTLVLGAGGDYTVAFDPNSSTAGAKITISLTPDGLAAIAAANSSDVSAVVLTTITATITGTEGDGSIENTASFIPNQAFYDSHNGVGTSTNTVTSAYGDLNITKVDPKDGNAPLAGAEFAVFIDPTPALGAATNTCTADDVDSTQTAVATGTTNGSGLLTIYGLQTSDFYDGQSQTDLIHYCLVETKAPTGYNLLSQPISFTILVGTATGGEPAFYDLTVNNQKANLGNSLPLTGGQGVAALSIGGVGLVGAGLIYYLVFSRRQRNAQ